MPTNPKNDQSLSALSLAWELGYTIAVPLVVLALLGRFLDKKMETSPVLLLTGILLSLVITGIGIARKTMRVMGKMEDIPKNEEQSASWRTKNN